MGTGALQAQPEEELWHGNISPNSQSQSSLRSVMACENCTTRFHIFKRKKICATCCKAFCNNCMTKKYASLRKNCHLNCLKCSILESETLDYDSLMKLKVNDLRHYLRSRNIATQYCTEKKDLVDLIIRFNVNRSRNVMNNASITSSENDARSENLRVPDSVESVQNEETGLSTSSPPANEPEDSQEDTTGQEASPSYVLCRRASLSDVKYVKDIDILTIRQLKEILVTNYVDYRGCCEKKELIDRVRQLWTASHENQLLREANSGKLNADDTLCKICMDATIDCVLLECGHLVACTKCGKRLAECPVCRQFVIRVVHIFKT